jgi:hypothetical protein
VSGHPLRAMAAQPLPATMTTSAAPTTQPDHPLRALAATQPDPAGWPKSASTTQTATAPTTQPTQ